MTSWDVSKESVEKSMDIIPLLKIAGYKVGQKFVVVPLKNAPQEIKYVDKKTNLEESFKVLPVYEVLGSIHIKQMLPLGSKSLQLALLKIQSEKKSLIGLPIEISVVQIDYKDFKEQRGYVARVLTGEESEKIKKMNLAF